MDINTWCRKNKTLGLLVKWMAILSIFGGTLLAVQYRRSQKRSVAETESGELTILSRQERATRDDCASNETVTSQGGVITSPGFPEKYPSNANCRWLLTTSEDNNIVLRVKSLDLEKYRDCELDYLQVYLGASTLSPSVERFCGTIRDKIVATNSSTVLLVFHSDPSYEDKGFSIEYYLQSSSPGCPNTVTGKSGTLTSPGFPLDYPDNTDCWTLISVEDDQSILFQFTILEVEFDENCTYDFVEVFDGHSKDEESLGRYCSAKQITPLHSTGSTLLIHFHSDHLLSKKGFRAQYTTVIPFKGVNLNDLGGCLWESESTNGSIASPNYPQKYPSDAHCTILLKAPPNHIIEVTFDTLQLEAEVNCSYDYLEMIEDVTRSLPVSTRLCGRPEDKKKYTSSRNILLVVFRSDNFAEFSGFKGSYKFHRVFRNETTDDEITEDYVTSSSAEVLTSAKYDPEDFFLEKPQNATLAVGTPYMLHCAASDPVAKIRWLKDEQFLGGPTPLPGMKLVANNTLWIQGMSKRLVGVYTCAAVTPEKTHYVKAWVKLEGDVAPDDSLCNTVLRKQPRDVSFTEGELLYMECLAVGNQVQVHWEKDGERIETKKPITVTRNGFLLIEKIRLSDAGRYTCVITDAGLGCQKRVTATLTVNGKAKLMEVCGRPKVGRPSKEKPHVDHGKIVGGNNAKKGAYPWQVMLWEPTLKSFCGGTLINERWIITAAHCFVNYKGLNWDNIIIKIGKHSRETEEDGEFRTVIAERSAVILHPAYDKLTFDHDIALVRLRDHVKFTDYIIPICLGDGQLSEEISNRELTMGTVTGWGKLKENGASPKHLQEIRLPVVSQERCINSTIFLVTRNMFCAGYSQEILGDACYGDSGGPFVINDQNKWYLYGIVSWGEGCGLANKYGFYTRVTNYLPWIKGIMKS